MNFTDEIPAPWKITDTEIGLQGGGCPRDYARTDTLKADDLGRDQAVKVARPMARLSLP